MSKFDQLFEESALATTGSTPFSHNPIEPEKLTGYSKIGGKRRVGRPAAKRSNPGYKAMTHILNVDTHRACLQKLREEELNPDFSDFLNGLMIEWLKIQQFVLPKM